MAGLLDRMITLELERAGSYYFSSFEPRGSNPRPCAPQARDLAFRLANDSSWLGSSGFRVPWYNGQEVEMLRDLVAVTFSVVWLSPDQQPELNSSK